MSRQQFEYHPIIGYRFIPNLKARIPHESGGYLISTNSSGFRCNHDFITQKKQGKRRILLFGDSFTAGDGVSNEKRFGDLLEKKISDLEVYNFGLPGTCVGQQYLVYKEYANEIEHDLMIIGVYVQNIRRTVAHYRYYKLFGKPGVALYAKPYFELINGELVLMGIPPAREPVNERDLSRNERESIEHPIGGRLRSLLIKTKLEKLVLRATVGWDPFPGYNSPTNPEWQLMNAILKEWIINHPQPVLLMPIPVFVHVDGSKNPSYYQARFRELTDALPNCILHDPLPDLLKCTFEERRQFRFITDDHFRPQGHLAIANSMVPIVENLLNKRYLRK